MSNNALTQEEYVLSESQEIQLGENIGWTSKILSVFPALKSRNYSLYFFGQLISMIGTWLQIVAEGWLVFQLTHSAYYVGLDAAAATVPTLFLSLFGGVIIDRFSKKKILIFTQTASMILAFILGILTVLNIINVWIIIILAFLLGVVNAVDMPARQAFVVELVDDKKYLASAIALNSGMFNASRVIGPMIAGLLIAAFGAGIAFLLNGISYIAVIIALNFIRTHPIVHSSHMHPLLAIKQGLTYAFSHPTIRLILLASSIISIFGWSYNTLMPVIAENIFHLNASGLGILYACAGGGALVGAIMISAKGHVLNKLSLIIYGSLLFSTTMIIFTFVQNVFFAGVLLFIAGFGLVSQFSTMNTVLQHAVDPAMRGRVMAINTISFIGLAPLGNLEIGWVAEHFGSEMAIRSSAAIILMFGLWLFMKRRSIHFQVK